MTSVSAGLSQSVRSDQLPEFSVDGYAGLLDALRSRNVDLRPVSDMAGEAAGPVAYLRHDIDLHVPGVERIAAAEATRGASATYFVLLTQHYNPLYPPNRKVLRDLVQMGHEIGLHYDLMTYPVEPGAAVEHLRWEIELLSSVVSRPVRTISMHQPYEGRPDSFRELNGLIHPHNPRWGSDLVYVSDSCRAWRDESLVEFLRSEDPQRRLLLLTHPELWLDGSVPGRMDFLQTSLMENTVAQHREFIEKTVRDVWQRHPGPTLHDAREQRRA